MTSSPVADRTSGGPAAKIDADSVMATKSHSGAVSAPWPGRGPEHQADHGHEPGQLGQSHEVTGPPTLGGLGDPVAGTLQHHHQWDPLLAGQLAEAVALVGRAAPDRPAEHGDVLGAGQRRPAVDATGPGHQGIARDRRVLGRADQQPISENVPGSNRRPRRSRASSRPRSCWRVEPGLAAHGPGIGLAPGDPVEGRAPSVELVLHTYSSRGPGPPPSAAPTYDCPSVM